MNTVAIAAHGLAKQYRLGEREPYRALRDVIAGATVGAMRRRRRDESAGQASESRLWALRDVSFQVRHGEVMGLIGRNGSGKSTLLKILSRVTEPTQGYADVAGRVGSLLEVGTGFHPELTGRENIYLNGAILGMKRVDIRRRFADIVAFAELGDFVDTPVKRYSSGMYVRLAFAVAAHLEPDILLVDEVLAVGDAAFQKRCLGKMNDVAREGRTVVFVSHDMTNISVLCETALLLESGRVRQYGPAADVVGAYLSAGAHVRPRVSWEPQNAPGDDAACILGVAIGGAGDGPADATPLGQPVTLELDYQVHRDGLRLNPVFAVRNPLGTVVFSTANYEDRTWGDARYRPGRYRAVCVVPGHLLNEGAYRAEALLVEEGRRVRAHAHDAVEWSMYDDGSTRGGYVGPWEGLVRPRCEWMVQEL